METMCDTHLLATDTNCGTHAVLIYNIHMKLFLYLGIRLWKRTVAWGYVCVDVLRLDTRESVNVMLEDPLSSDYWRGMSTRAPCCDKNDKRSQTVHSLCDVQWNGIYAKFRENSSSDFTSHYRLETRGRVNWQMGIIPWDYLLYERKKERK